MAHLIDTDSVDGIIESYEKLIEARNILQDGLTDEEYNNSGAVDMIEGKIAEFQPILDEYLNAKKQFNESVAKQDLFKELSENGIPETSAELDRLKTQLIEAAKGGDRFSGSSEDISSAFDSALNELKDVIPGLSDVMNQSADVVEAVSDRYALASGQITQSVEKASESAQNLIAGISAAQKAINSQQTGKSVYQRRKQTVYLCF